MLSKQPKKLEDEIADLRWELDRVDAEEKSRQPSLFARIREFKYKLEVFIALFAVYVAVFALLPNDTKAMWMYWVGVAFAAAITIGLLKSIFRPFTTGAHKQKHSHRSCVASVVRLETFAILFTILAVGYFFFPKQLGGIWMFWVLMSSTFIGAFWLLYIIFKGDSYS